MSYVDRGLQVLINQWKNLHPGAVVGTYAGASHTKVKTDHVPDWQNSVDAADFMPGAGDVTTHDLDQLAETLRRNRDPRIAYVIRRDKIFSSTIQPWEWRKYTGHYHGHCHVSVNDKHANQTTRWKLVTEKVKVTMELITGRLPILTRGMSDPIDESGWYHVTRFQRLLGVKPDGDYGPKTAAAFADWKKKKNRPGNGDTCTAADWKALIGLR